MSAHSPRIAFVTALICVGLLSAAFYLEFISGLVPCALCLAQRAMFALIGIACLLVSTAVLRISPDLWSALFR